MAREKTPPVIRLQVLERDSWQCQHCGATVLQAALEVHHKTALADGGSNDLANLQTLCVECHVKHHQEELAAKSPTYRKRREWARHVRELQTNGRAN